jgi:hypothetical protein
MAIRSSQDSGRSAQRRVEVRGATLSRVAI